MELTQKKIWVKGLMIDCPMGSPDTKCEINDFRRESVAKRLSKVEKMSHRQLDRIINYHTKCIKKREEKPRPQASKIK